MSQTFNQSFATHNPKPVARAFHSLFREHVFLVNTATFAVLVLLCVGYIIQVNGSISKGYQIRELENQIQELTLKNQTLELDTQRAQSLDRVTRSVKMLGLVDAEQPEYLSSDKPALAMAN